MNDIDLKKASVEMLRSVAEETTDVAVLDELSSVGNRGVRLRVIHNPHTLLSTLKEMKKHEHEWVMVYAVDDAIEERENEGSKKEGLKIRDDWPYDDALYPSRCTAWDCDLYPCN